MAEPKVKEDNHFEEDQDRISQLNNEILILILSLLSLMEAGRTCVLSKRWTNLWKHLRCLHIDCEAAFKKSETLLRHLAHKTVPWVNQVLQLHQGSSVDELKIRSCLLGKDVDQVDNWVEFAMQKRVKRLELDLKGDISYYHDFKYVFPAKPFKFLTHLSLIYVNVSCEVMKQLLSHCQLLEQICVCGSTYLYSFRVMDSPLIRLKSLQISECNKLVMVKISAPNLVSFTYEGVGPYRCGISMIHAPSLVKVHLGEDFECITKSFMAIKNYFSQLVTLSLGLNLHERTIKLPEFPEFTNLRDLSLTVVIRSNGQSLLNLTSLIERSPFLHSFTFQIIWKYFMPNFTRNMLNINESPHRCLKVVKFSGFIGLESVIDTELAMYLIQNAVVLDKLILDIEKEANQPRYAVSDPETIAKKLEARRDHALQLGAQLPPGAELIVM